MCILKYFQKIQMSKVWRWRALSCSGLQSRNINANINRTFSGTHSLNVFIFGNCINMKSRYFEAGYSRYNLRDCWSCLPRFWTTESVTDHKAKRNLAGNLTTLIQCFGPGTTEKHFFEIYPTGNCGLDCSKDYS